MQAGNSHHARIRNRGTVKLFVKEFRREAARLAKGDERRDETVSNRLKLIETELASLYQNLLAGLASPALRTMIAERQAEMTKLEAVLISKAAPAQTADILPHPALLEQFARKVEALRASLDDDAIRLEASAVLASLIESVTIYPAGEHGPEAEVIARTADLIAYAANENSPRRATDGGCSVKVVAGTGSRLNLLVKSCWRAT